MWVSGWNYGYGYYGYGYGCCNPCSPYLGPVVTYVSYCGYPNYGCGCGY
jgi:hypothetical protein